MKEFLKSNRITYNLMSFTGFKTLFLFSLLLDSPKSYDEILEYFLTHPYLKEQISADTLRVYLTSMRKFGCIVTREKINGKLKYGISENPFELKITKSQISSIIKTYKYIKNELSLKELFQLEIFIKRLSERVCNKDLFDKFIRVSVLKNINLKILEELFHIAEHRQQITILYKSPRSGLKEIELLVSHLGVENGKVYLYGFSKDYNQDAYYLLNRVVKILNVKLHSDLIKKTKGITVGVEYFGDISTLELKNNEKLLKDENGRNILEITSTNKFVIKQRVLALGTCAKVLYPESFQKDFIATLKDMKAWYFLD